MQTISRYVMFVSLICDGKVKQNHICTTKEFWSFSINAYTHTFYWIWTVFIILERYVFVHRPRERVIVKCIIFFKKKFHLFLIDFSSIQLEIILTCARKVDEWSYFHFNANRCAVYILFVRCYYCVAILIRIKHNFFNTRRKESKN